MKENSLKIIFIYTVICVLVLQIIPLSTTGDSWTQTTQVDFETGTTFNTNVTLSPGNVVLDPGPMDFVKAQANPVLDLGPSGSWDDFAIQWPSVLKRNEQYEMWYSGNDGSTWCIGFATSSDGFNWTKHPDNPVLQPGPLTWDDSNVFAPSVLWDGSMYKMWYTGHDGSNWRIGHATSLDGLNWTKNANNPVLVASASGWDDFNVHEAWVIQHEGIYKMWYSGTDSFGEDIGYATSIDGVSWIKYAGNPVFSASESWEDGQVRSPTIIVLGGEYHMIYTGNPTSGSEMGYAKSIDGINWTKSTQNPVLTKGANDLWDDYQLWGATLFYENSMFRLWYGGWSDVSAGRFGNAFSQDCENWTKKAENPVLDPGKNGEWDDIGVSPTSVIYDEGIYKMWYSGFDGSHNRIGYAISTDGINWAKPILGLFSYGGNSNNNIVVDIGSGGSWNEDTSYVPTVIKEENGQYKMWFTGARANVLTMGYATSPDGITWTEYPSNPVISEGTYWWENTDIHSPTVINNSGLYEMWYTGIQNNQIGRIGYANSSDGISWVKYPDPVLDAGPSSWDNGEVFNSYVMKVHDTYEMWYVGIPTVDGMPQKIGYATSSNGINWTKYVNNPVLSPGASGQWDDYYVNTHSEIFDGTSYKMWYAGSHDAVINKMGYAIYNVTSTGTYESSVFDSGYNGTLWNTINWNESLPPDTEITISTRSGDTPLPDVSWSDWSAELIDSVSSIITSPRSRYIQYRATLISDNSSETPIFEDITINYDLNSVTTPTLSSPIDDLLTLDNTPEFIWIFDDPNGDLQSSFILEIDDDPLFGSIDYSSGEVSSPISLWTIATPLPDGTWYWRLKTMDEYDLWSEWSEIWAINIDTTPPSLDSATEDFTTYTGDAFVIYANFTDEINVTSVTLHYTKEIGSWKSMLMTKDFEGGPGITDNFSLTSADLEIFTLNDPSDWYFFFEATNGLHNSSHGNAMNPFTITVIDNIFPIADGGPDQLVDEDSVVTLDGTDSTDNDLNGIHKYEWKFFDEIQITLPGSKTYFRFSSPGVYEVNLSVSDAAGNSDTDSITITVRDITPPKANAGLELTITEGTSITFDGTNSIDNSGNETLSYEWSVQIDETTDTLDGVNPNYTFEIPGIYFVTLNVTDSAGNWGIDTIVVTVLPDFDRDGLSDEEDPDDDEDGTLDADDDFPFDPDEDTDTDHDGVGNNADPDDDGDSFHDSEDTFPEDPTEWRDTDGDGIGNNKDPDDDNDGITDENDYNPLDDSVQDPPFPWWLLVAGLVIGLLLGVILSRRRESEEEVAPSEAVLMGIQEEEEPRPEPLKEPQLPVAESVTAEKKVEAEPSPPSVTEPIPPLTTQDLSDDEIFENIKKKFEEGKISEETFEDFKKRYKKE
jgi:predicted GH43/DUF377 family glycosyl hydrolase